MMYPDDQFQMIAVIISTLGCLPKCLNSYDFIDREIKIHMKKRNTLS